ncbi:MAG: hypothetical protein WBD01_11210 [Salaquimonas sp.]
MAGRQSTQTGIEGGFSDSAQQNFEAETSFFDEKRAGFDVIDLLNKIWKSKRLVLICTFLAFFASVLMVAAIRFVTHSETYEYIIQLTFTGVNESKYPNGTPFDITQIISSSVLSTVYDNQEIANFSVDRQEFARSIFVTNHTDARSAIVKKYESIFDTRKSTLAELEANQRQMQAELEAAARSSARITYANARTKLPPSVVNAVLLDIVKTWSSNAVELKGVLNQDIDPISADAFSDLAIAGLDPIDALNMVSYLKSRLNAFVKNITSSPGGELIRDPVTSASSASLESQLKSNSFKIREIASTWSNDPEILANQQRLSHDLYSSNVLTQDEILRLDYLIGLELLEENVGYVMDNIQTILDEPFGATVTDPETSATAFDLARLVQNIRDFDVRELRAPILQLGIAKNREVQHQIFQSRISELRRNKAEFTEKSRQVLSALNIQRRGGGTPDGSFSLSQSGSTLIPQMDEGFLDRIIDMSDNENANNYNRKLINDAIAYSAQVAEIDNELARLQEYQNYIEQIDDPSNSQSLDQATVNSAKAAVLKSLSAISEKLSQYAESTIRISKRINVAREIHQILEVKDAPEYPVSHYLADNGKKAKPLEPILAELKDIAVTANRMNQMLGQRNNGGIDSLQRPLANPTLIKAPLFGMFNLLLIVLLTAFAAIASAILGTLYQYRHSNRVR